MNRAFIILIALSLSGCFADQEQLVASCEFDAIQTYPREKLPTGAHIGDYMQTCMKVHGYDWNLQTRDVTSLRQLNAIRTAIPQTTGSIGC
jgi:hypothetical protein